MANELRNLTIPLEPWTRRVMELEAKERGKKGCLRIAIKAGEHDEATALVRDLISVQKQLRLDRAAKRAIVAARAAINAAIKNDSILED